MSNLVPPVFFYRLIKIHVWNHNGFDRAMKKTHSVASTMCLMKASTNNDGLGGRLLVMKSHDLAGAAVTGQYDGGLGNNAIA